MNYDAIAKTVSAIGGRRFIMAMGAGMACTLLCWLGKISGSEFVTATLGTVGLFIGGNTAESIKATQAQAGTEDGK